MIEFRLLGSVDLKGSEGETLRSVLAQPKRVALLAYVAVARPNGFHRRDKLLGLFWPESDQERGRGALRKALYFLRQSLGEDVIVGRGDEEIGLAEGGVWCDAVAFEEALDAGKPEEALELYRGDLLEGFYIADSPEFERWLEGECERLRRRAAEAAWALAADEETAGNGPAAEKWARRALTSYPNDEGAFRRLLELLDRLGNRTGAIEEYEAFARRSQKEYEAAPAPETQALISAIRQRVPSELAGVESSAPATEPAGESAGAGESVHATGARSPRRDVAEAALSAQQSKKRRIRGTVAAAVMILTLVAAAVIVPRLMAPDAQSPSASTDAISSTRVAVFPFQVQGSPEAAYLGEAVTSLLSEAVDGLGELRRVDPFALMGRIRREDVGPLDPNKARELARHFGAGRYVLGNVVELGNDIRLSASLYGFTQGTGPIADASARGKPEELPELVRQLTRGLLAEVRLGSGGRLDRIATVEAANWTALKAYLQGEALMRRGAWWWHDSTKAKLRAAVEADSTFALAWYRLSVAQAWGLGPDPRQDELESIEAAMRYRERLSPRDRLVVEAAHAFWHGKAERAERLARSVAGTYPDHTEAWYWLGETRYWYAWQLGLPRAQARQALARALRLDPGYPQAVWHATWLALLDHRYSEALALFNGNPRIFDATTWGMAVHAWLAFGTGDRKAQQNVMRELEAADDNTGRVAGLGLVSADSLRAARRVWKDLAAAADRSDWGRATAQAYLAHLEVARGRWASARAELDRAADMVPAYALASRAWFAALPFLERPEAELAVLRDSLRDWRPPAPSSDADHRVVWGLPRGSSIPAELRTWIKPYTLGLLSARLGDSESAERRAMELDRAVAPPDTIGLRRDLAREIRALTTIGAGRPQEALALLEGCRMAIGHWTDAFHPLYRRPLARFLRAELLREMGREGEALGWYESFNYLGMEYVFWAPVNLRIAEIYEGRGNRERAVDLYRSFVARWQDADPEYQPLVADAQARIARLTGDRPAEPTPNAGSR